MPQHQGLPVSGYRPQGEDAVKLVNDNKQIEQGFMAVNRAVFRPARVELA